MQLILLFRARFVSMARVCFDYKERKTNRQKIALIFNGLQMMMMFGSCSFFVYVITMTVVHQSVLWFVICYVPVRFHYIFYIYFLLNCVRDFVFFLYFGYCLFMSDLRINYNLNINYRRPNTFNSRIVQLIVEQIITILYVAG